jgi:hypothetical protein
MISRPCRISLQRPRFLLEAFPIHRLATSSAIAVATSPPYSIDVPHLTFKTSIIALTPRPMSKSSRGSALPSQRHPSLRLIGRLLLINNTNTNFSSKTPSPPRVQYHHSPLAYLRRFFRPQSKLQLSYPQFFLSHSKSPRGTRIPRPTTICLLEAVEAQHLKRPSRVSLESERRLCTFGTLPISAEPTNHQFSMTLQIVGLMIYLLSSSQSGKSLTVVGITPRNAQCIVIAQRSHSSVSNVLDHSSLSGEARIG